MKVRINIRIITEKVQKIFRLNIFMDMKNYHKKIFYLKIGLEKLRIEVDDPLRISKKIHKFSHI